MVKQSIIMLPINAVNIGSDDNLVSSWGGLFAGANLPPVQILRWYNSFAGAGL